MYLFFDDEAGQCSSWENLKSSDASPARGHIIASLLGMYPIYPEKIFVKERNGSTRDDVIGTVFTVRFLN